MCILSPETQKHFLLSKANRTKSGRFLPAGDKNAREFDFSNFFFHPSQRRPLWLAIQSTLTGEVNVYNNELTSNLAHRNNTYENQVTDNRSGRMKYVFSFCGNGLRFGVVFRGVSAFSVIFFCENMVVD